MTNISVPYGCESARAKSKTTPEWSFETAPMIYSTDVEEHYFGIKGKDFNMFNLEQVKNVYFIERMVHPQIQEMIYGNKYEAYYEEVKELLKKDKEIKMV